MLSIGWENGASFAGQSLSEAIQNQSKRNYHSMLKSNENRFKEARKGF